MPILVDYSQMVISSAFVAAMKMDADEMNEGFIKHLIFNSIRSLRTTHKPKFGELVVAVDSRKYWRKDLFPGYKHKRKLDRSKSEMDFEMIFRVMDEAKSTIREVFGYKVIEVEGAEADDIIGTISSKIGDDENILIISSDKDFIQLQKYKNVYQWSPVMNKYLKSDNPSKDLLEKVIRGDAGDGIPNILSPINSFVEGIRQKPLKTKQLDEWLSEPYSLNLSGPLKERFEMNQTLIDLTYTPAPISEKILQEFYAPPLDIEKKGIYNYLLTNQLQSLISFIGDF